MAKHKVRTVRTRKRRKHSLRRLKVMLLALGISALVIGIGLGVMGLAQRNPRLRGMGGAYVVFGLLMLASREAVIWGRYRMNLHHTTGASDSGGRAVDET